MLVFIYVMKRGVHVYKVSEATAVVQNSGEKKSTLIIQKHMLDQSCYIQQCCRRGRAERRVRDSGVIIRDGNDCSSAITEQQMIKREKSTHRKTIAHEADVETHGSECWSQAPMLSYCADMELARPLLSCVQAEQMFW